MRVVARAPPSASRPAFLPVLLAALAYGGSESTLLRDVIPHGDTCICQRVHLQQSGQLPQTPEAKLTHGWWHRRGYLAARMDSRVGAAGPLDGNMLAESDSEDVLEDTADGACVWLDL